MLAPNADSAVAKCISSETVNPDLKGILDIFDDPISRKAKEIEQEIQQGNEKPFNNVIRLNVGDAQSLGQTPITFSRQVIALVAHPVLMNDHSFPEDAKHRAREFLDDCCGNAAGAYTVVGGVEIVRKRIAEFIKETDDVESNWENIYIEQGAGDILRQFLRIIKFDNNGLKAGILHPTNCPPHADIIAELGLHKIDYYTNGEDEWKISIDELQRAIDNGVSVCKPRAIIVVNPGNPTSHILTKRNMEEIVEFALKNNLIIIADEVYRTNVLNASCTFIPFRRILRDMGKPYREMELVTLMSMSDGVYAENGSRCGYSEMKNFDPEIPSMMYRSLSTTSPACSLAQAGLYSIVNPPKPNEPSYEIFEYEKKEIIRGLQRSAAIVEQSMVGLEGFKCNPLQGGIFFYPSISLSKKAIEKAINIGLSPDEFYSMELLKETGICVMPGSRIGQKPGTYHIRMTLSSDSNKIEYVMKLLKNFHSNFMKTQTV